MVTWKETTLGAIGTFSKGRGISKFEAQSGKIPCVRYGEIYTTHNDYVKAYYSHISDGVAATSRQLRKGELLFAGSGETKEEIGKCVAFIDDCEAYAGGDIIILTPNSGNDSLFLGYYLNSRKVAGEKASRGQGDAIVHIGASSLADIEIKLPPLPEQRAIAIALSDTDAYIDTLEKLIAKKRAIKKGTMQELLKGKRRLPGFSGEWVEKKLGEFGLCIRGVSYNPNFDLSNYMTAHTTILLRANNIVDGVIYYNDVQFVDDSVVSELQYLSKGDILIAMSSGSRIAVGKTGTFNKTKGKYCVGAFCAAFRSEYNNYIRYLFQSDLYKSQLTNLLEGTSINNLNGKQIEGLTFMFAPTIEEQTAIAEILSDMDVEIDALTAKLNKVRDIKQGMMQELLTGRIRLVNEETEAKAALEAKPAAKVIELPKREPQPAVAQLGSHNQQFDDAVMIAGIVNALYSDKYPLGRKKVQKCLYFLRRHQDQSTAAFKKKAAGPYADKVRYKGGEPIAVKSGYIRTQKGSQGTKFAIGAKISQALGYIQSWGRQADFKWLIDKLKYKKVDELWIWLSAIWRKLVPPFLLPR
jgi:type I restriction enzyme S subunit